MNYKRFYIRFTEFSRCGFEEVDVCYLQSRDATTTSLFDPLDEWR